MGRFLIQFSYIGTHYRGMQIQREAGKVLTAVKTVQGVLEDNLRKLNPANEVMIKTSSRTDSGVHALCNACDVELIHRKHPVEFNPQWITVRLNKALTKSNERLRILNTYRVPADFASRIQATERSYVYRLALVKTLNVFTDPASRGLPWTAQDCEQSYRVYPPFDMGLFLKAAEMLSGRHNFMSFSTKNFLKTGRKIHPQAEMKIRVQRGSAMMEEHRRGVADIIDHWEIHFHGHSFLYKQVRRMMGAMVGVARGKMSLQQLQHLLDHPSLCNPGRIEGLPGHGLTLKEVHYPDSVLCFNLRAAQEAEPGILHSEQEAPGPGDKEMLQETVHSSLTSISHFADTGSDHKETVRSVEETGSASEHVVSNLIDTGLDHAETVRSPEKTVSTSQHVISKLDDTGSAHEKTVRSPEKTVSTSQIAFSSIAHNDEDHKEIGMISNLVGSNADCKETDISHDNTNIYDNNSDCEESGTASRPY